jgi:hypothetical protein
VVPETGVRAALAGFAAVAAVLAAGVSARTASATNECRGLLVCVHIAGPWVVVPAGRGVPRPHVEYQMTCPRGYVVGGLDAELTDRAIDISFVGSTGSPVAPGITTSRTVVFVGTYVGNATKTVTFRPHVGCVPATGGGARTPTAVSAVVPPGKPATRRVRTVRVTPTVRTVVQRCRANERLVDATSARAFFTRRPPSAALVSTVSVTNAVRGGALTAVVRGDDAVTSVRAVVQLSATCAGGR